MVFRGGYNNKARAMPYRASAIAHRASAQPSPPTPQQVDAEAKRRAAARQKVVIGIAAGAVFGVPLVAWGLYELAQHVKSRRVAIRG